MKARTTRTLSAALLAASAAALVTGSASAQRLPALTSLYNPQAPAAEVFFVNAVNQRVTEYYKMNGQWSSFNRFGPDSGVLEPPGVPLGSLYDGTTQYLFFLDNQIFFPISGYIRLFEFGTSWQSAPFMGPSDILDNYNDNVPSQNGGLSTLFDGSARHLFYIDRMDDVHEFYGFGDTPWFENDITVDTGDVHAVANRPYIASFWDGQAEHVVWVSGNDGHIHTSSCVSGNCWVNWRDLTPAGTGAAAVASCCTAIGTTSNQSGDVFYVGTDFHVYHIGWHNGNWTIPGDISIHSGAPNVAPMRPNVFTDQAGTTHLFAIANGNHDLIDLFFLGVWQVKDLTKSLAEVTPYYYRDMQLTGFSDPVSNHEYYAGVDGHLHEAIQPSTGGTWSKNDLNILTGDGNTMSLIAP